MLAAALHPLSPPSSPDPCPLHRRRTSSRSCTQSLTRTFTTSTSSCTPACPSLTLWARSTSSSPRRCSCRWPPFQQSPSWSWLAVCWFEGISSARPSAYTPPPPNRKVLKRDWALRSRSDEPADDKDADDTPATPEISSRGEMAALFFIVALVCPPFHQPGCCYPSADQPSPFPPQIYKYDPGHGVYATCCDSHAPQAAHDTHALCPCLSHRPS